MAKTTRVQNLSQLATALGCTRQSLVNWRKDSRYQKGQPTAEQNGTYIVEKFAKWLNKYDLKGKKLADGEEPVLSKREALQIRKLEAEVQEREIKTAKIRGELVDRAVVKQVLEEVVGRLYGTLDRVFGDELPPRVSGLTLKQISALNREELKRVFGETRKEFQQKIREGS